MPNFLDGFLTPSPQGGGGRGRGRARERDRGRGGERGRREGGRKRERERGIIVYFRHSMPAYTCCNCAFLSLPLATRTSPSRSSSYLSSRGQVDQKASLSSLRAARDFDCTSRAKLVSSHSCSQVISTLQSSN